jgi:uncharacterized protein YidB (DUF937 family)
MNNNPLLGQVLGGLFGAAMSRRGMGGGGLGGGRMGGGVLGGGMGGLGGGMGGGLGGGALGSVLGGMLGGRRGGGLGGLGGVGGGRGALLVMLLPLAMRWVQRNGGMGAVLKRFQQQGYGKQAQSWVATGDNEALDDRAVEEVVGREDLADMAQRLGVPETEVKQAFAEIMPQMVDQLSPQGDLPQQADEVLDEGVQTLEKEIADVKYREVNPS